MRFQLCVLFKSMLIKMAEAKSRGNAVHIKRFLLAIFGKIMMFDSSYTAIYSGAKAFASSIMDYFRPERVLLRNVRRQDPHLPEEVLAKIFSYTTSPRDIRAFSLSCKEWRLGARISWRWYKNFHDNIISPLLHNPYPQGHHANLFLMPHLEILCCHSTLTYFIYRDREEGLKFFSSKQKINGEFIGKIQESCNKLKKSEFQSRLVFFPDKNAFLSSIEQKNLDRALVKCARERIRECYCDIGD